MSTEASAIPATRHNPENGWDDKLAASVGHGAQVPASNHPLPIPDLPPWPEWAPRPHLGPNG